MKKEMSAKLVEERLEQLMNDEKIFINPVLTITLLSQKLMISQRMLSGIINDRYQVNFNFRTGQRDYGNRSFMRFQFLILVLYLFQEINK
jgi:hypothetical protein